MIIPNGDQFAGAFLASKPDYDQPAWLDAYAMAIGRCKPDLTPTEASRLAIEAYKTQGHMNPKVCAGLDATLGPHTPLR